MSSRTLPRWLATFILSVVLARGLDYVDEWPADQKYCFAQPGAWVSAISVSVLQGESSDVARLPFSPIDAAPPLSRPKPRPRLGADATAQGANESGDRSNVRIERATRFLSDIANHFYKTWNAPLNSSEVGQFTHEIEAECVLIVDKRSGVITVESIANSPDTELMASLRKMINDTLAKPDGETQPFSSAAAELDRLRSFVLSLSPFELPDSLTNLSGDNLRIRIALRLTKAAYVSAPVSTAAGNSTVPTIPRTRRDEQEHENLLRHTDINDPVYQTAVATNYFRGIGLSQNYSLAAYWFQKAADQGYSPAERQVGFMYNFGLGVERDSTKALFWYGKAAAQHDCTAIYNIACMYLNGDGVPRDPTEAIRWLLQGAELRDVTSETTLASVYAAGENIPRNPEEAFKWYLKAAEQGNSIAQYKTGEMYENGSGVPEDKIQALAWYNLAPTSGLANQTDRRERLERELGPAAALEARQRAKALRLRILGNQVMPGA